MTSVNSAFNGAVLYHFGDRHLFTCCQTSKMDVVLFGFQSPGEGGQDLFSARFEPQILAAVSRHVALFPPERPDDSYPPQLHKASQSFNRSPLVSHRSQKTSAKWNTLSPEKAAPRTDDLEADGDMTLSLNTKDAIFGQCNKRSIVKLQRHQTMRYALNPVDFMLQNGTNTTLRPMQLPFSNETLASLSTFCFPGIVISLSFT